MILVDRGNCSFATKVYYGELSGAQVVIIADYEDDVFRPDLVMVDDMHGVGKDVGIPSMMISYNNGKAIKDHLKGDPQKNVVSLLANFEFVRNIHV